MRLRLSSELIEKIPGIQVAALVIKNLKNQRKQSNIAQLLRGVCAKRKLEFKDEEKKKAVIAILNNGHIEDKIIPEVQLLESKVKKAGNGKDLPYNNNLEGLLNHFSVKNLVPIYGWDLDEVAKDLEITILKPKQGKHPDDFVFNPETRHIVVWLIDIGSMEKEEFSLLPLEFSKTIQKYCGGIQDNLIILNADNRDADLGYVSEKEKIYQEEQKQAAESEAAGNLASPGFLSDNVAPVQPETLLKDKILDLLGQALTEYLTAQNALKDESLQLLEVQKPNEESHGDYATSIALKLAKEVEKSPQEIAESIIQLIPKNDLIDKAEMAGPGFINVYLAPQLLAEELDKIISLRQNFGRLAIGRGQNVVVDYSSPNIAKPLGVHHLLSTVIGQTIADLMRFAGYNVISANYLGDWGTQFGKLIYAYRTWGDEAVINKDPLNELLKLYVKFHDEAEKDPALEDKGREEFKKLEEGDPENTRLLNWMREISINELERIYKILGVKFDEYLPESKYTEAAKKVIEEGKEKGILEIGEKGAWVIRFENDKYPPYILQKADGTTIYATRDVASIRDRIERLKANLLLYVVDVAQSLHFNQLFDTAQKYGLTSAELKHIVFGRMQMPEGRMSTRKGEIILLDEVIKEAAARAQKLVDQKSKDLSLEEKTHLAQAMAVSAIKYNIISQNRETNITFDLDRMLSLDGNSSPYLQYTLARAQSILRKDTDEKARQKLPKTGLVKNDYQTDLFSMTEAKILEENIEQRKSATHEVSSASTNPQDKTLVPEEKPFSNAAEQVLLHQLPYLPEAVSAAVREYKPNLLANYLYEVARAFNGFYDQVSVLSAATDELRQSRLKLVEATVQVLKNGLTVLGIATFERM